MKLLFLLLLLPFAVFAQIEQPAQGYGNKYHRIDVDSALKIPTICGSPVGHAFKSKDSTRSALCFDSCGGVFWIYNPRLNQWQSGSGGSLQNVTDIGNTTTDTIIAEAIRTKRCLPFIFFEPDYEIDIFPDLQNMTKDNPAHSRAMFQWVVDNRISQNIKAVIGVGDITNNNTVAEMDTASHQFGLLDAVGMPYMAIVGNHDYSNGFNPASRDAVNFNNFFGPSRYVSSPWYKGHFPGEGNQNFFISFEVLSRKFLGIALEFLPRDTVIGWAKHIIDSVYAVDPTRDVIISTHAYQSWTGQLATDTTIYSTATYGMSADNDGQELWNKLIKTRPSIKFVFNGHFIVFNAYNGVQLASPTKGLAAHIQSTGDYGNMVNQLYVNYQDDTLGGHGYMMRMKFHPLTNKIDVSFYSATLSITDTRPGTSSFTIDDASLSIQNAIATTGNFSAGGEIRSADYIKSEKIQNRQVIYGGTDHKFFGTDQMQYSDSAGFVLQQKITADTVRIKWFGYTDTTAYFQYRIVRSTPGGINFFANFDSLSTNSPNAMGGQFNYNHYKNAGMATPIDFRRNYTLDSNLTRALGTCETCPQGMNYLYTEVFLDNNTTLSASGTYGSSNFFSRNQIRGGSSSSNRAHTTGFALNGFASQLFIVSNVDTLGEYTGFRDILTGFDQGNAVKNYYSFRTNAGTSKHIRSWGFYQENKTLQRNYFAGQTLIGDSSIANAGTAKLFVDGGITAFNSVFALYDNAGSNLRIKIDNGHSAIFAPNGTSGIDMANDSTKLYGLTRVNDTATRKIVTISSGGGLTTSNWPAVAYGTFSPTATLVTNMDGATVTDVQWSRIGNIVTVSGRVTADATAPGAASFRINLPIASNLTAVNQLAGTAAATGVAGQSAGIQADATNDAALFKWVAVDLNSQEMMFTFTYQIL